MSEAERKKVYDLEERTAKFGEAVIALAKKIPKSTIITPLISQLVRAGTSVGSNYCEADCAESRKDFEHKLGICKKEAKESKHWLRMVQFTCPDMATETEPLRQEAHELQLIFIAIINKSRLKP